MFGVPVERDADVRLALLDLARRVRRVQGAAGAVDVQAVRTAAEARHVRPELGEHGGRDAIGGPVCCIDHDLEPT